MSDAMNETHCLLKQYGDGKWAVWDDHNGCWTFQGQRVTRYVGFFSAMDARNFLNEPCQIMTDDEMDHAMNLNNGNGVHVDKWWVKEG